MKKNLGWLQKKLKVEFFFLLLYVKIMKKDSFEQSLKRLEDIVEKLESGNIPLDEAIKLFEEGVKLSKKCSDKLSKVEEKIKVILGKDKEGLILEDFKE